MKTSISTTKSKRVITVAFDIAPQLQSGIESILSSLIPALKHEGVRPLVVSLGAGRVLQKFRNNGITVIKAPASRNPIVLARLLEKWNVDLANSFLSNSLLAHAAKLARKPLIWTSCTTLSWLQSSGSATVSDLAKSIVALADRVVCLSKFSSADFFSWGNILPEVIVPGLESRPQCFLETRHPVVACVGRMIPQKCHADFIEAAALVQKKQRKARFLILGSRVEGDDQYRQSLKRLAIERGVQECLSFGYIDQVMKYLDILVHCARDEAFGMATLEAMAHGKPVIVNEGGGSSELVRHEVTGLVVSTENPTLLADAILRLLRYPKKARNLGRQAAQYVSKNHSLKLCAQKYRKVYDEAIINLANTNTAKTEAN